MTKRQLAALFERLNLRYFSGRLPRYRVEWRWYQRNIEGGRCNRKRRLITLRRSRDERVNALLMEGTTRILIHEMAHAATTDEHGSAFTREMKRLRRCGAPVDDDDIRPVLSARHMTPSYIRNIVKHPLGMKQSFRDFCEQTAIGLLLTPDETLTRYPWLKREWLTGRREYRLESKENH